MDIESNVLNAHLVLVYAHTLKIRTQKRKFYHG